MLRDLWPLIIALIVAALASLSPYARLGSSLQYDIIAPFEELDLSDWDLSPIQLDQHWHWYPEHLLQPGENPQGSQRQIVKLPHYFAGQQQLRGKEINYGSYRLRIKLPSKQAELSLALALGSSCSAAKVYFYPLGAAGRSIKPLYEIGKVGTHSALHHPGMGPYHSQLLTHSASEHYELIIQVAGFDSATPGLCEVPVLGLDRDIYRLERLQLLSQGFIVAFFLCFGLYAIGTSIAGSRNRSYLWIGSAAVLVAVAKAGQDNFYSLFNGLNAGMAYHIAYALLYSSILIGSALALGFLHHSFKVHFFPQRFVGYNLTVALLLSLPFVLLPMEQSRELVNLILLYCAVQYGLVLNLLHKVLSHRLMHARRLTLYIMPLLLIIPYELLEYLGAVEEKQLLISSIVFLVVIQGLNQSQKLARASQLASRLSEGLGDAVQKRTADLHLKNQELLRTQQELTQANQELRELSVTDGLTSVFNRMYFDRQFISEWQRSRRDQRSLCLILIDVDHFKKINDQYGHASGDEILRNIAQILLDQFKRSSDLVCRYGGEEFVVILNDSTTEHARLLAEQLRQRVESSPLQGLHSSHQLTVSVGVCGLIPGPDHQPLDLLNAADQALYQAKREGRNCVRIAEPPKPSNPIFEA